MCINKRVVAGLGAGALLLLALSPRLLGAAAPLLIMAVCPLSMILMMRTMHGRSDAPAANNGDGEGRQLRELEEEVNRLKAELHIRDQERSS